jgi:hypothetical protein
MFMRSSAVIGRRACRIFWKFWAASPYRSSFSRCSTLKRRPKSSAAVWPHFAEAFKARRPRTTLSNRLPTRNSTSVQLIGTDGVGSSGLSGRQPLRVNRQRLGTDLIDLLNSVLIECRDRVDEYNEP